MIHKIHDQMQKVKIAAGLIDKKPYTGPWTVQIDITNNCNNDCVGCWCHSPLLGEIAMSPEVKKKFLSWNIVKKLIDDLDDMGVRDIYFTGAGEPFAHPNAVEIMEYVKSKGIRCDMSNNFSLITKEKAERLVKAEIDNMNCSIWAGSPEGYERTHPNKTAKTFNKIKENLLYIDPLKKNGNPPKIRIYNVISSHNYHEIDKMIEFALESEVEEIEFQVIDIVNGRSEELALTEDIVKLLLRQIYSLEKKFLCIKLPKAKELKNLKKSQHKDELTEFNRIVKKNKFLPHFRYFLDDPSRINVFCSRNHGTGFPEYTAYKGDEDLQIENAFKFYFNEKDCHLCRFFHECTIDKKSYIVKIPYLSLLGMGSFIRRIKNIHRDHLQELNLQYDENIVDTLPCYIGWTYVRILPNGDVIPCCKAYEKSLGNINKNSFKEIWYSQKYNEFRYLAKTEKKSHPYFKVINCYKSCDNLGMNLEAHLLVQKDMS